MAIDVPLLIRHAIALIKTETTYGTDAVPTGAADGVLLMDLSVKPVYEASAVPEYTGADGDANHVIPGMQFCEVGFKMPYVGYGLDSTDVGVPRFDPALQACHFARADTGTPVTSRTYTRKTLQHVGATIHAYYFRASDGAANKIAVTGWNGSVKLIFDPSSAPYAVWEFTGTGILVTPVGTAAVSVPTLSYYEPQPATIKGMTATLATKAVCIRKIEFDFGVGAVAKGRCLSASTGYAYHLGVQGPVTGSITVDALYEDTAATSAFPYYTNAAAATEMALSLVVGTGSGKVLTFAATKMAFTASPDPGNEDGVMTYTFPFVLKRVSAGDDSFSLVVS